MPTFTHAVLFSLVFVVSYNDVGCVLNRIRWFPADFKFGAATAAYQIEGGWNADGKGPSIWDTLTHKFPSVIKDRSNGDIAADSYNQWKQDVELVKELGLHFYRFSISWPRILPNGMLDHINQAGLDYYSQLIDELLRNNIQPMVTLFHWDLPETLQKLGGFGNPMIVDWFVSYAKVIFNDLGSRVKYWITINEPKQICFEGYGSDQKAPRLNISGVAEYICARNVLLAHAAVYRLYDEYYRMKQNGTIGISISCTWYEPASDTIDDHQAAEDARQFDWGQYAHPIFSKTGDWPQALKNNIGIRSTEQDLPKSRLPEFSAGEVKRIKGASDFFGINTYTTKLTYRDASLEGMYAVPSYMDDMSAILVKDSSWPQSESSWLQSVPWGFYKLLTQVRYLYDNPPIIITENGWSSSGGLIDDTRVKYHKNYLNAMLDAIEEGSNIKGYTAWSLMDNFEWMNGYTEKFGLFEVDFSSPERKRTPRKSAYLYKDIISRRTLDVTWDIENTKVLARQSHKEHEKDEDY